jgi:cephalosporin hydroxylase
VDATDNFGETTWLGHPIWQNVLDLWVIQEAISEVRPSLLLETGTHKGGSALFYAHLFDLLDSGEVVTVDVEKIHDLDHARVTPITGSSIDPEVVAGLRNRAQTADGPVMVILDSDHSEAHVRAELDIYSEFVTPGSLLLAQDGVIDVLPCFAHGRPGPLSAINSFLAEHAEFVRDDVLNARFLITHHPSGWLRRIR